MTDSASLFCEKRVLHCFVSSDAIDDLLPLLPPCPAPENIDNFLSPPIGAIEDFRPPAVNETDPDPPASCGDPKERSGTFAGDMFLASFFGCIDVRSLAASLRWRFANWHSRGGRVSSHSCVLVPFPGRWLYAIHKSWQSLQGSVTRFKIQPRQPRRQKM